MKLKLFSILFLITIGSSGCMDTSDTSEPVNSEDLNLEVYFDKSFENTIYPSFILGFSSYTASKEEKFDYIVVKGITPKDDCTLKITLKESLVNYETVFQKQLGKKGEEFIFSPEIRWNYEKLKNLKQQGTLDLAFSCEIDGENVDNKLLKLKYRSINECIYFIKDKDGKYVDVNFMFAAYVNEEHPKIDVFLQEVLKNQKELSQKIVDGFYGYQKGEKGVLNQLFAIWHTLQKKGVKYSSITNTSNPSQKVITQYVRLFDEVYNNTQANCVDGTVFLSSILKKIGIKPFLVLAPGHMYLGFFTSSDKSSYRTLETTMIGGIDLESISENTNLQQYVNEGMLSEEMYTQFLNGSASIEDVKRDISLYSFIRAVINSEEHFSENLSKFENEEDVFYQIIDIELYRKIIQPVGKLGVEHFIKP